MTRDELLIGVDGGATEVKAHAVACDPPDRPQTFRLRPEHAARHYERVAGFEPIPVQQQLADFRGGSLKLRDSEREQGARWIEATADVIADVARQCGGRRVRVGIGMPGLKTADARGIAVLNNGPRIPDFLDRLEVRLAELGVELVQPIRRLGSDADYCGLGEQHADEGAFRDVDSAYYLGGGTGIADALKLRGRLVPFDEARDWILKSWQIPSALGPTFERLASAASLNRIWADLAGPTGGTGARYPEQAAAAGDPVAQAVLRTVALVLAELIGERLHTILLGRPDAPHRGQAYAKLRVDHPYRGTRLDRVVIGQRIGQIFADEAVRPYFADPLRDQLEALLRGREGEVGGQPPREPPPHSVESPCPPPPRSVGPPCPHPPRSVGPLCPHPPRSAGPPCPTPRRAEMPDATGQTDGGQPPPAGKRGNLAVVYLDANGRLPEGFLVASRLRAAPALGAAIDAVLG